MKKVLLLMALTCACTFAQAVRVDPTPAMKTAGNVGPGGYPQLLAVPGPQVSVCNAPANGLPCTNYATTYSDSTAGTACPTNAPLTLKTSNACVTYGDTQGNFGFWILPGSYTYTVSYAGQTFGPYPFTVPSLSFPLPALGPQLTYLRSKPNVTAPAAEFAALPQVNSADYNFTAQTPGGTLTGSSLATVTLTPGPLGVKSGDVLYVSGGSGTAEVVSVTGGTCTGAGNVACTVQFTPANSHSGSWNIASATSGLEEAINALPGNTGSVYVPPGPIGYCGTLVVPTGVRIYGAGDSSLLVPCSSSQVMMSISNAPIGNIEIDHLQFDGTGVQTANANTVSAIKVVNSNWIKLHDLTFRNTQTALNLDRLSYSNVSHVNLYDNSAIFLGDTTGATYAFHDVLDDIRFSLVTNPPMTVTKVITLSRANNVELTDINMPNVHGNAGISLENDCQGVDIKGAKIIFAAPAVQFKRTTVGVATETPTFTMISNSVFDGWSNFGITMDSWTGWTTIANSLITTSGVNPTTNAISMSANVHDININGNLIQGMVGTAGSCNPISASGVIGLNVVNNQFDNQCVGGAAIFLLGTGTSNVHISANTLSKNDPVLPDTTTNFVTDVANTTRLYVVGNNGVDDVIGADLASAASISPTNPIHRVTGVAAIATINRNASYTGLLTLIPTAAWTLTTGGNIATASTAVIGKAMTLTYNTTTNLWYPSY